MSLPTVRVELAVSTNPTETPTWVDVTRLVRSLSTERGRQRELDRIEAGTLALTLDNRDRRFEPGFAGVVGNVVANPSAEVNTTGWAGSGVGAAPTRSNDYADKGTYSLKCSDSVQYVGAAYNTASVCTPGATYVARMRVYRTETAKTLILWFGDRLGSWDNTGTVVPAVLGWNTVAVTRTIRAGATDSAVLIRCESTGGSTWYVDGVQVYDASLGTLPYCDGDQDNCRWAGTAHASASYWGGPYYPNLRPMRRVRVSATWQGTTYPIYTGYVEEWPLRWPGGGGLDAVATLRAADGLMVLAGKTLTDSYPQEGTGARVDRALSAVSWTLGGAWVLGSGTNSQLGTTTVVGPVGDRAIDDGASSVQAATLGRVSALEHLQTVAEVEQGLLFVGRGGEVVFRNRRTLRANPTSRATLGDGGGDELPYHELGLNYGVGPVVNEARVTLTGSGTTHSATDATSQARYFQRTREVADLPLANADGQPAAENEAQSLADDIARRYGEPGLRVESVTLYGQADDRLWPHLLGREIGDCVTVVRRPTGPGAAITQASIVEGVRHEVRPGQWQTEWWLSPVDGLTAWQLGDPLHSQLGVSTNVTH